MASESILLKAEAKKLGVEGYRRLSDDELRTAIKTAKGVKGKSAKPDTSVVSSNGTKGKSASKSAVKGTAKPATEKTTPAKGKATVKSAPAKSTAKKSSPAKGKASSGAQAKRQTADKSTPAKGKAKPAAKAPARGKATPAKTGWQPGSRGRVPASATKAQLAEHKKIIALRAIERAPATTRVAKSAPKAKAAPVKTAKKGEGTRSAIDRSSIDWTLESNVGQSGKRKEVLKELRKRKGNYQKVYDALVEKAKEYYPKKSKADAQKLLRWLINRVAYDYVMSTDQHQKGTRNTSPHVAKGNPNGKPKSAAARKAPAKAPAKQAAKKAPARKPAAKSTPARKPAAAKGKAATKGKKGK